MTASTDKALKPLNGAPRDSVVLSVAYVRQESCDFLCNATLLKELGFAEGHDDRDFRVGLSRVAAYGTATAIAQTVSGDMTVTADRDVRN